MSSEDIHKKAGFSAPGAKLEPASDLRELWNNLNVLNGFNPIDRSMYVESLYKQLISDLRIRLLGTRSGSSTHFVVGQSGTGKTTALTFLPDEAIRQRYSVVFVKPTLNPEAGRASDKELNVVNVLVNIGSTLFREAKQYKDGEAFILKHGENFLNNFREITGDREVVVKESGNTTLEVMASILKWITRLDLERHYIKEVREHYRGRVEDLVDALQEVIYRFEIDLAHKPLLLFIDDWEKLRDLTALENIFLDGINDLCDLKCVKVITIPITLAGEDIKTSRYLGADYFFKKVLPYPKSAEEPHHDSAAEEAEMEANRQALREIVWLRTDPALAQTMFPKEELDEAIRRSGGNVRQYVQIAAEAAFQAHSEKRHVVTRADIDAACNQLNTHQLMGVSLNGSLIRSLVHVREHFKFPADAPHEQVMACIVNCHVFFCRNGLPYYRLNPFLENLIAYHASLKRRD